jgi:hypothetical protein
MNRRVRWPVIAAVALGIGGFSVAWYGAMTSRDAEVARDYLLKSPAMQAKYKSIDGSMLTGFRISNSKSHFTYWVRTAEGRKFVKVVVDKSMEPRGVMESP